MYQRIVVPLDGSKLAEGVLPAVCQLAEGLDARVRLISVADIDAVAPRGLSQQEPIARDAMNKARRYLESLVPFLPLGGGRVQVSATVDNVAQGIVAEAEREADTLLAMSTHGRSGVGRFVIGSIADRVLHSTKTPLLLYRPRPEAPGAERIASVIVPLDGSTRAQKVLPSVRELAQKLSLSVILIRARRTIPSYGGTMGVDWYDPKLDEEEEAAVAEYLAGQADRLRKAGVKVSTRVMTGTPAAGIVDLARDTPGAMVAMTTRGRSGAGRAVLGSVADRVVGHSQAPVLLVRT
jgi:nucleotide-binding universal stress UspA family protein